MHSVRRLLCTFAALPLASSLLWAGSTPTQAAFSEPADSAAPLAGAVRSGHTLFGLSLPDRPGESPVQTVNRTKQRFDTLPVVRIYSNKPPTTWQADPQLAALPKGTSVIYTFDVPNMAAAARGDYDGGVIKLLTSRPSGAKMWIGLMHEPEGHVARHEFTAAQYRAATGHVAGVTKSHGGIATTVLTARTAFGNKGKAYRDYYHPAIDVLAWNAYNSAQKKVGREYKDPSRFIDPIVQIARETGTGFGWAEFGAPCIVTDPSCAQRAKWLTQLGNAMSGSGAQFVAYWNRRSLNGKVDYSLSDAASADAWKRLMAG